MLARLAALGLRHPRRVVWGALLVFVLAAAFGGPAAGVLERDRDFEAPDSESWNARVALERATGTATQPGVLALVEAPRGSDRVHEVARRLRADRDVASVVSPPAHGETPLAGRDPDGRRSSLVLATLRADADRIAAVERLEHAFSGAKDVDLGGPDVAIVQVNRQAAEDLASNELLAFPLLAILTFLVFRGVAAFLPLAVGVLAVLLTFALLRILNLAYDLSPFCLNLVIAAGLGLAIDYSLFLVSRFREELGAGLDVPDAVRRTMATAGRTVVFSALTVASAIACLYAFPVPFLQSMAIGGALVSVVAGAVALTLLPALFVLLGARLGRVRPGPVREGRWYRIAHASMRRPLLATLATAAVVLLIASPALRTEWAGVDASVLPESKSARVVDDRIAQRFPALDGTDATVVVRAPDDAGIGLILYANRIRALPQVERVDAPRRVGPGLWRMDAHLRGSMIAPATLDTVRQIRAVPSDHPVQVGGGAAALQDQRAAVSDRLPIAILLLAASTLIILWLMTGSVVLPVKALIMNLLTTAAATGALVWVFQDGRSTGLLDYRSQGGIEQTDFLVMVAVVFGLSTDYGVFLLTRIKEARDAHPELGDKEAVAVGIQRTGGIVTAAAILLAVALGAFLLSSVVFLQELGGGAAFAVLLDALIIRTFLVPSLMALLGARNWWSPAPLRRLHARIGISEGGPAPGRGG
ncbi:MMPL family transporter [Patulibacter minatonensis]|uniref:MMPL family transporter n=1 Tax=Patulibacter minatonensis TaxID=298163 RepID=UPI0004B805F9|nr:MMPL family transporter [Patulibacter minatonensis]